MRRILLGLLMLVPLTTLASNIHEYTLKNGLTLLVKEDHRAPVVLSSIWYKVGGSYERNGITGVSHVLEHMMFKGTKKYGPGEFDKIISRNGGQQNAMTSSDFTMYYQKLAADKLPISFKLEADRMKNLLMERQSFQKELQVVLAERRMRVEDNPQGLAWVRFNAAAYINNPYHHPVIGWATDIKHLTLEDANQWYRTWYAPNNAVVVVVGDVKPSRVFALAKKYFGSIKPSKLPVLKPRTEVPYTGLRQIEINAPAKLPSLLMGYNVPSLKTAKKEWQPYALAVAAGILSSGNSSRFSKDLIRGQQVAVGVDADYDIFQLHGDLFVVSGIPNATFTIKDLQTAIFKQLDALKTTLATKKEMDRIKAQLIAQNVYKNDSLMAQAFTVGGPMMSGLSWQKGVDLVKNIEAVTPQQVQAVAKEYFVNNRLTVAVLKPTTIVK